MKEEVINYMVENNSVSYNLLKAIEELNELSLALTQRLTKPKGRDEQEVIDEIGDVKIRIEVLEHLFDKQAVEARVRKKIKKFNGYIEQGKFGSI